MRQILGIDPGPTQSGWVIINPHTLRPVNHGISENHSLTETITLHPDAHTTIEMISSYGMPVGADVFQTCVWIGRFIEHTNGYTLHTRTKVRLHHCGSQHAKDPNVVGALVERFAPGQRNRGKGTKTEPGWFHGFRSHVWQAYALAVYHADIHHPDEMTGDTTQ